MVPNVSAILDQSNWFVIDLDRLSIRSFVILNSGRSTTLLSGRRPQRYPLTHAARHKEPKAQGLFKSDIRPPPLSLLPTHTAISRAMSSLICVICLDDLQTKSAMSTTCGHVFCSECAASQFIVRPSCPVCRTAQTFEQLIRLFPEYSTPVLDPPTAVSTATTATIDTSPEMREPELLSFRRFQRLQARQLLSPPSRTPQPVLRVQPPAFRQPRVQPEPQILHVLQPRTQHRLQASAQQLQALRIQRSVQPQHLRTQIPAPQLQPSTAGSSQGISYVCHSQSSDVTVQVRIYGAGKYPNLITYSVRGALT